MYSLNGNISLGARTLQSPPSLINYSAGFTSITTRSLLGLEYRYFLPHHRTSRLDFIFINASHIHFYCVSHSTSPRFCLGLSSIFITELTFYGNFSPYMQLGYDQIFAFFHRLASIYFQFWFEYINARFTMLCHEMLSLGIGSNFLVHLGRPQQRLILCIQQLSTYAKEVYF